MMKPFLHIFGHPNLPMDPGKHPEDAQVRTCYSFCVLASFLSLPYCYYGLPGSLVPDGGTFRSIGTPTDPWQWHNRWHKEYTGRMNHAFSEQMRLTGKQPQILCSLYGAAHSEIDSRGLPTLEPMTGYNHCWAQYHVFPSLAQQNILYATCSEATRESRYLDRVIPHFLLPEETKLSLQKSPKEKTPPYLLFLGRDTEDKGISLAREIAEKAGLPLKIASRGWQGKAKCKLLKEATALLMPTFYPEPFGYSAIEAQCWGTPVLAPPWGAFPETILPGKTGFLCRNLSDYLDCIPKAAALNRSQIRRSALRRFSLQAIAPLYADYFSFILERHSSVQ